jgi:HSP20 family protein
MSSEEDKDKRAAESESVAGGILKGIGKIIPGLGDLVKSLEKSPAFKEKLKEIDEEVEQRMREAPLKRTQDRPSSIPGSIPPGARERGTGFKGKPFVRQKPQTQSSSSSASQEKPVDIFDEKDHIKVIAEIPGVQEEDIKVDLVKDSLEILVDTPDRKYEQVSKLPCNHIRTESLK